MGAKILTHIDLQVGVTLPAPGDERGQHIGSDRRDGADGDAAFQGGVIAQFFGGIFDFEQDAAGAFEENFAGLGEDGFATEAVEETSASRLMICWLSEGWLMFTRSDARVKLPVSATATT